LQAILEKKESKRGESHLSTPKGMRRVDRKLETGDKVHIYSDDTQIVLQIRHEVPTEENLLEPSFKTAVSLNVAEAMTVAGDLLHAASLLLSAQKRAEIVAAEKRDLPDE
jgi:hypothetical protein